MKKFCSALMIFFAFTIVLPQRVFAADVPNFSELDSENIKLAHTDFESSSDFKLYGYICTPNTAENFMKRYSTRLLSSGSFKLTNQFERKLYGEGPFEVYLFKYIGSKKISSFYGMDITKCNVEMFRVLVPDAENLVIIQISPELNYVEKNLPLATTKQPKPVENNSQKITPVSTNQTGNSDVPDIEQLADEIVYHHNQRNGDRSITYIFKAGSLSESRADEFVDKYISLLTSSNFVQTGYDKKQFIRKRVQATRQSETWTFDYKGSKSIWALSDGNALTLKRIFNPQTGDTSFEVRIANGLTFAGKYDPPKPIPEGKTPCSDCYDGKCDICKGTGYYDDGSGVEKPCAACDNGNCRRCKGTGYV